MKTASKLELADRAEKRAKFMAALPLTLLQLMTRAHMARGCTFTTLTLDGELVVRFRLYGDVDDDICELSLHSEEWEVLALTKALDQLEDEAAKAAAKQKLAAETWDTLTPEQREALGLSSMRPSL